MNDSRAATYSTGDNYDSMANLMEDVRLSTQPLSSQNIKSITKILGDDALLSSSPPSTYTSSSSTTKSSFSSMSSMLSTTPVKENAKKSSSSKWKPGYLMRK